VGAPHADRQRLWIGLSISYLGDQFTVIALLWFVLQLTGSGAAVGLVILCFDLPGVVTGAILGRLLDGYQPRLVMGIDNLARATLIAAIPTLYAVGWLQLWRVLVLALLAGALSPATTAGVRVFVPHLVDDAALDRANALTATSLRISPAHWRQASPSRDWAARPGRPSPGEPAQTGSWHPSMLGEQVASPLSYGAGSPGGARKPTSSSTTTPRGVRSKTKRTALSSEGCSPELAATKSASGKV
jgi:hypothetical protein